MTYKNFLFLSFSLTLNMFLCARDIKYLELDKEALIQLQNLGLYSPGSPLKLHLGCGSYHFDGYVNIDLPPNRHTVQNEDTFGADIFADAFKLNFPEGCVDEIRLHHLFEHFDRGSALGLICKWRTWLKKDGILYIETPDFKESARMFSSDSYNYDEIQSTIRHIFGSQEADWAYHLDGWYKEKFEYYLSKLNFYDLTFDYNIWKMCPNIIVKAKKGFDMSSDEMKYEAIKILKTSMVDESESENILLDTWLKNFDSTLSGNVSIGKCEK